MTSFPLSDIRDALRHMGLPPGATVIVHGSMLRLGRVGDLPLAENAPAIVDCLLEHLGGDGTLAVPAFNFAFCRGEAFDRWSTPSVKMGTLAETVRMRPGSRRSRHPMQSVAAVGRLAADICDDAPDTAFTPGSAFARLLEHDAYVLLFGSDFQAPSVLHRAEEQVNVPYRYYKEFCGEYIDRDIREQRCYRMFVRDLAIAPKLLLAPVETELASRGQLAKHRLGAGSLNLFTARNLVDSAVAVLERDPMAFVAKGTVHAG